MEEDYYENRSIIATFSPQAWLYILHATHENIS